MNSSPTLRQIIKDLKKQPASSWCVDTLEDDNGKCCVVGFIGKLYFGSPITGWSNALGTVSRVGLSPSSLIEMNNGRAGLYHYRTDASRRKGIKTRVLRYLRSFLPNKDLSNIA